MGQEETSNELEKTNTANHDELAEAIQVEHNLSFREAVRLYPAAIGWSAFVSMGVIMLAFDPQLLGNLFAMTQFQNDFGYEFQGQVSQPRYRPSALSHCALLRYLGTWNLGSGV